ncbi:rolling circle replication-associated protein [Shewanella sp.]|uniref:rolling circle replication-associated protein n=1 Tax=Shewanella sp. TaxID=50422 RepID=UPI004048D9C7
MPCTSPLQGFFNGANGAFKYCPRAQKAFRSGFPIAGSGAVPCGQCLNCRLKTKREWAVRCVHEYSCWPTASYLTFTFSQKAMLEQCPVAIWSDPFNPFTPVEDRKSVDVTYSILRHHMQKFNKDLRERLAPLPLRFLYCGEYGKATQRNGWIPRPHYHSILFNYDFPDKRFFKFIGTKPYYNSDFLSSLWPHGHAVISDFTFDSAAYVGGYVTEKVGGKGKNHHYKNRIPEFAGWSNRPGLGRFWLDKYWRDVYPSDELAVDVGSRIILLRPPRAYDKRMNEIDPILFESVREKRRSSIKVYSVDDLRAIHDTTKAKFKRVVKHLEND